VKLPISGLPITLVLSIIGMPGGIPPGLALLGGCQKEGETGLRICGGRRGFAQPFTLAD